MCEVAWKNGIPVSPRPADEIISLRYIASACGSKLNDKYVLLNLKAMRKADFLELMRSLVLSAPPPLEENRRGAYTWIVYSTPTTNHAFAAVKVRSFLELGTIHNALVALTGAIRIHAAGEFRIPTLLNTYHVNFESGTFMRRILYPDQYEDEGPGILTPSCTREAYLDFVKGKVAAVFPGPTEFYNATFIGPSESLKWTLITPEELQLYREYGARIELYDTREECTKAQKGALRRTTRRRRRKTTKSSRVRG